MTTVTEPNGSTVTSVYDADSELTDTTDQDGRRTTYSYDKDGAQTGESWVNGSGTAIYIATYTYRRRSRDDRRDRSLRDLDVHLRQGRPHADRCDLRARAPASRR